MEERKYAPLWLWFSLFALYMAIFGTVAYLAPGGVWANRIYELELWSNNDPGGWYLPSAHEIYSHENGPLCPGHQCTVPIRFTQYGFGQTF